MTDSLTIKLHEQDDWTSWQIQSVPALQPSNPSDAGHKETIKVHLFVIL